MAEFKQETRKFCRNPKCRAKLPSPVENPREAFCCKGCRERFYRLRCYVCEEKKTGRLDAQTCGRRKCKNAMRTLKTSSGISRVEIGVGKPIKSGVRKPLKTDRPWRIVAGRLTAAQYHFATVSDAPGGSPDAPYGAVWSGGDWERIEARNRAKLYAHYGVSGKTDTVTEQALAA